MAPTEQVSMTVLISRSITWSTEAKLKSAISEQRIDRFLAHFGNRSFPGEGRREEANCARGPVSSGPSGIYVTPWDVRDEYFTGCQFCTGATH